ncbi:HAD family phosphatase [Teredinibacter sp. KSP-S5-2]|uniref:HAD family hydrolase n=1 Tax=Teredinibacter sp. KSP-S5-2 TaxID=3034506 RepID=UPI002934BAF5|nr:HAD family phosphatase [Teredinibacter sp. KSP-S5-2]WNO09497.1 HAD family phosphatase [Teredinibacter sp. KSP-S5-2]
MIQAVIFDHDGTLVDSEAMHFELWRSMLAKEGVDFEQDEYIRELSGLPKPQTAEYIAQRFNTKLSSEELYKENIRLTHEHLKNDRYPLMPYVQECLQACKENNMLTAVATGAARTEVLASLKSHQLDTRFDAVCSRSDVKHPKPAPDVYIHALEVLGIPAAHAIALEDTQSGVQSAKDAGLTTIAIPNAFSQSQDFSRADYTVKNLQQAWQLIQRKR